MNYLKFGVHGADAGHDWMAAQSIIAELDYYTAQRHGLGSAIMIPGKG